MALYALRSVDDSAVDASQYIHSLTYADLSDVTFRSSSGEDESQLQQLVKCLEYIRQVKVVPARMLRNALTKIQYVQYIASYDFEMSHVEADVTDEMPLFLYDYLERLKQGDKYTRIAKMLRRAKKKDVNGKTAFGRNEDKAFGYYEEALMDLLNVMDADPRTNFKADAALTNRIQEWLDRPVDTRPGWAPDVSAEGMPRIRGIKSVYAMTSDKAVVGNRLRRYWRQREAVVTATLQLLYEKYDDGVAIQDDAQMHQLREKLQQLLSSKS